MADDFAAAVIANRRDRVNRAFETVEHVRLAVPDNFEGLVVVVSANLARCHSQHLSSQVVAWTRRVCAARFADADRWVADLRLAADLACRASAVCEAAL